MNTLENKIAKILILAFVILSVFIYFVFSSYVKSTSLAIINGWLDSEATALQQGNFLSAVTKSQRIMLSSNFIQGVSLVKILPKGKIDLIQFGQNIVEEGYECPEEKIAIKTLSFFSYKFTHCFEADSSYQIRFYSKNTGLRWFFIFSILTISFSLGGLIFVILNVHKKEIAVKISMMQSFLDIARQVAHDIRSPLSSINIAVSTVSSSVQEAKLINEASRRINEIAEDLLQKTKSLNNISLDSFKKESVLDVVPLALQIVEEKNLRLNSIFKIDLLDSEGCFVAAERKELLRIFSNLINNSLDAVKGRCDSEIIFAIRVHDTKVQIMVIDNGLGIPEHVLSQLGTTALSYNKENGSGLGLSHAQKYISSISGTLSIQSKVDRGTIVTLTLPKISSLNPS